MKIHLVDQGSSEWYALRLGIPTASNFHRIVTPGGKLSTQAVGYRNKLIAERLLGTPTEDILTTEWVERGKAEQPHALQQFQLVTDLTLTQVGFVTTDDGRMGCSPDYVIEDRHEAVEVKCPAPWTMIGYMLDGLGTDYRPQVQGQLLVGEFEAVHFYGYHPRMPAVHILTRADRPYLDLLAAALDQFCDELDAETERAKQQGVFLRYSVQTPRDLAYAAQTGPEPHQTILDAG